MPGEFGQVGSYITGVKMVLPSGELLEVTEDWQPELMKMVRCCYGTFGIVYEVTYRIRPLLPMAVHHETFSLEDFVAQLPALKARGDSMFYYIFPFDDKITIEFRRYNPGATGEPNHVAWGLRNYFWGSAGPKFGHDVTEHVSDPTHSIWHHRHVQCAVAASSWRLWFVATIRYRATRSFTIRLCPMTAVIRSASSLFRWSSIRQRLRTSSSS